MSNSQNNRRTKELMGRVLVIVGVLVGLTGNAYVVACPGSLVQLL